jgi:pimeloyl-ACP methyl ester carboxylesterase
MFEASFFSKGRLFGAYHPAHDITADRLLVICPPFFDEYRRCYRALAELANGCAAQGTHVFRFDYFGTGESWGLLEEATVGAWVDDVRAAIEEGIALSGASRVYLCGVRFGATLAAQVRHPAIVEYIFWDVVASGTSYLEHLAQTDKDLEQMQRKASRYVNITPKPVPYEMFHLTPALRETIDPLHVDLNALKGCARVHRIVSQEAHTADGAEYSGLPYSWPTHHDGLFLPKAALEAIVRRLT